MTSKDMHALYIAASLARAGLLAHIRTSAGGSGTLGEETLSTYRVACGARCVRGVSKARALALAEEWCGRSMADIPARPTGRPALEDIQRWYIRLVAWSVDQGAEHINEERRGSDAHVSAVSFRVPSYELSVDGTDIPLASQVTMAAEALGADIGRPVVVHGTPDALARAIAAAECAETLAEDANDWSIIADNWVSIAREQRKRDDED